MKPETDAGDYQARVNMAGARSSVGKTVRMGFAKAFCATYLVGSLCHGLAAYSLVESGKETESTIEKRVSNLSMGPKFISNFFYPGRKIAYEIYGMVERKWNLLENIMG